MRLAARVLQDTIYTGYAIGKKLLLIRETCEMRHRIELAIDQRLLTVRYQSHGTTEWMTPTSLEDLLLSFSNTGESTTLCG